MKFVFFVEVLVKDLSFIHHEILLPEKFILSLEKKKINNNYKKRQNTHITITPK